MLQSIGSQRVGHDSATEQQQMMNWESTCHTGLSMESLNGTSVCLSA